jgi:hypothetical protein
MARVRVKAGGHGAPTRDVCTIGPLLATFYLGRTSDGWIGPGLFGNCDAIGLAQKPWRVSNPVNWFKPVRQDQQAPALEGLTFVPSEHTR